MDCKYENGIMTIFLCDRIDSSNAAAVSEELQAVCAPYPDCAPVLDAKALSYISSAGLRAILALRKKYPGTCVINVAPEVYEVFEMTGFTEILTIRKAFRELSVDGCEIIGTGACGTVYRYTDDTIIKVYKDPDSLDDIRKERELARKAFVLGVPTAIPYDVVRVGNLYGSVFELLDASSLCKLFIDDPAHFDEYVRLNTDLMKKIHAIRVTPGDLPDMKAKTVRKLSRLEPYLPEDVFRKLMALAEAVPDSDRMLHGDYHVKNVMMQKDEVLLIDMDTLCVGDPILEFSCMYMTYQSYSIVDRNNVKDFLGIEYDQAHRLWEQTLKAYWEDKPEMVEEYLRICPILANAMLMARFIHHGGLEKPYEASVIAACKEQVCAALA